MSAQQAKAGHVLVLDDEPDLRTLYELALRSQGHVVDVACDLAEARQILKHHRFDVLISDMRLPDGEGLALLQELQQAKRAERCVVITAYGSADNAVAALKAGAFDYLTKPVDLNRLRQVVLDALRLPPVAEGDLGQNEGGAAAPQSAQRPVATERTQQTKATELADDEGAHALSRIVGESAPMRQLKATVAKVARSMAPVLVTGESGTGKELVARALHACSHRSKGPFVAVNCGAIPEALLESEFFGAVKGAYTGAAADRTGYFQAAHGGTLFLDEIGELPLSMQSKLLRAVQERHIRPLGASQELSVDVRIVSATHRDLSAEVQHGRFRQDLYYRIHVIGLELPALRERRGDLPALCDVLLSRLSGQPPGQLRLGDASLKHLEHLPLAGNVRELENLLHRAYAMADGDVLDFQDLPDAAAAPRPNMAVGALAGQSPDQHSAPAVHAAHIPADLTAYLDTQERAILLNALQAKRYNRTAAALQVGISLRQMRYRMQRLGIELPGSLADDEPS